MVYPSGYNTGLVIVSSKVQVPVSANENSISCFIMEAIKVLRGEMETRKIYSNILLRKFILLWKFRIS